MVIPVQNSPVLRASFDMRSAPGDSTARAAAALLWQALNAAPADVLRMGDRMRALEGELTALQNASRKTNAEIARLNQTLSSSQPFGWLPWLAVLLLGVAATGAYYVMRSMQFRFSGAVPVGDELQRNIQRTVDFDLSGPEPKQMPASMAFVADAREQPQQPHQPQDAPPVVASEEQVADDTAALRQHERVVRLAESLQEAEFLVSIGFPHKAVDVLRTYIEETRDASPLAYLELLQVCRDIGEPEGVEAAENEFRRRFMEEPPRVRAGGGLDSYPAALAVVARGWHTAEAAADLEQLLFASPEAFGGFPGVQAYRDVMSLWHLLQERDAAALGVPSTAADEHTLLTLNELQHIDVEPSAQVFGVDLNLIEVPLAHHQVHDLQHAPPVQPVTAPQALPAMAERSFSMREFKFERVEEVQEASPLLGEELFDMATSQERAPPQERRNAAIG